MTSKKVIRIALVLAVAAVSLLSLWTFLLQDINLTIAIVILDRLAIVAWVSLILIASLSFGALLLRLLRLRPASAGVEALFAVGTGLGALSLITLGLGALGAARNSLRFAQRGPRVPLYASEVLFRLFVGNLLKRS